MNKPKRPRDANQLAKHIVDLTISNAKEEDPSHGKNPATVELRRLSGSRGDKARATKLTKTQRLEIANRLLKQVGIEKECRCLCHYLHYIQA